MRLGVLGTADIAFRRFLPALQKLPEIEYAGIASRTSDKCEPFVEAFGGAVYPAYDALLSDGSIDAVYVPLPPALHYEWGRKALAAGKHLLMEKPFTTSLRETDELITLAKENHLALHENYMFLFHNQLSRVKELIAEGILGNIRLYRMSFGFPKRSENDFRYNKVLGGGALLDCGGYPVRLALELLGSSTRVVQAKLSQPIEYEVDLYGNAVLENRDGMCAQISFGMDNAYQCQLEVWGSKATLIVPRIFTAGAGFAPTMVLRTSSDERLITLEEDDQFLHSIEVFARKYAAPDECETETIRRQAELLDTIRKEGYR